MLALRRLCAARPRPSGAYLARLSTSSMLEKGHSKWQNIKNIKQANDMRMSRIKVLMCARVAVALKENGNVTDPKANRALARVIEEFTVQNVGRAAIENAIKHASTSKSEGGKEFVIEIRGPGGCGLIVEVLGPKKSSLDSLINPILKKNMAIQDKGVASMFECKGVVTTDLPADMNLDRAEEVAIEAGAEAVEELELEEGERLLEFTCQPHDLYRVRGSIEKSGLAIRTANVDYVPRALVELSGVEKKLASKLLDAVMSQDYVMNVHHNIS